MNAAHWLWAGTGFMSMDEDIPSNFHAEFETEDQFSRAVGEIAKSARATALAIDKRFSSFGAIAEFVVERARSSPDRMGPSWWGYQAGVASALVGKFDDAGRFLQAVSDDRVVGHAALLLPLVTDPDAFRRKVNEIIAQQRARLKLKPLDSPAF